MSYAVPEPLYSLLLATKNFINFIVALTGGASIRHIIGTCLGKFLDTIAIEPVSNEKRLQARLLYMAMYCTRTYNY